MARPRCSSMFDRETMTFRVADRAAALLQLDHSMNHLQALLHPKQANTPSAGLRMCFQEMGQQGSGGVMCTCKSLSAALVMHGRRDQSQLVVLCRRKASPACPDALRVHIGASSCERRDCDLSDSPDLHAPELHPGQPLIQCCQRRRSTIDIPKQSHMPI